MNGFHRRKRSRARQWGHRGEGMGVKQVLYAEGLAMDTVCGIGGGFCMCNSRGLGQLAGWAVLEPFRAVKWTGFDVWVMTSVVSFRLWEGFEGDSACREIMLTG